MRTLNHKTILFTGVDGDIGNALLNEFIQRGAKKIYASDRDMYKLKEIGNQSIDVVVPIELDITNEDSIKMCTLKCHDIDILINNARVISKSSFIGKHVTQKALFEMSVNYIGIIGLINEFLPTLHHNSPSAIINILSMASHIIHTPLATYCASKTAAHIMTQTIRKELEGYDIAVVGVYPGYVDTRMRENIQNTEKITPQQLAINICNEYEQNADNIFPDEMSKKFYEKHPLSDIFFN